MKFLYLAIPTFLILLVFGCSYNQNVGTITETDSYEKAKEVAWGFIEKKGWNDTAKEGWKSAKVKKVIADNCYELWDKTYEGKEILTVLFEDEENVGVDTPLILVAPDFNEVIGYKARNFTLHEGEELAVYLSDIEQMNIGAEMPQLLYADNKIVVMQGTFGVVVYNMQDSVVTNRISYEQIKSYGISMMVASVSQDGTTIFIGNDDISMSSNEFTHQYDISTRLIKKTTQQPSNLYRPKSIELPGYHEQYDDLQYGTSHNIVELDNSFIYLRSSYWEMKHLQIVNCPYEDGENKVFDVFK
ncbi:hypothetical protein [Sporosarcina cyprini]|uniref:hypothetical protein n=1 Tax=Sporosarcina cyprini TaxID=2910523 RepID=UPI001EDD85FB|nr:hypothetical protein [Sporosarcina cyprini]MCG3088242.1 hypothetical protein [Sporosarcina cyprini]